MGNDTKNDTKRVLVTAAAFLMVATAASRVLGLVREIVQIYYLGAGAQMGAFTAAQKVPNLIRSLLADTALSAAFIPVFSAFLEKGKKKEAWQLAATVTMVFGAGLTLLSALCMVFAPQIIHLVVPGYKDPQIISLAVSLTRIMFPQVIVLGLCGIAMGILNAYDHFSLPAIAPIVWNFIIIFALAFFSATIGFRTSSHGIKDAGFMILAWATLLGTVVQLLMQLPGVWRRRWRPEKGVVERLHLSFRDPALWQMMRILGPVMISLGIINFNSLIDTQFASYISEASPVYIDKAFRLFQLPQGVFAIAIGTVLFPALSRHAIAGRTQQFREDLSLGIRQIFFFTLPFAGLFVALSVPTIRLIYQHGAAAHDLVMTKNAASSLTYFSVGMAFVSVNTLLNRAFYSIRKAWLPLLMGVVNLCLNALFDWVLYKPLGVGGITLSTSLVSTINFFGLIIMLSPRIGGVDARRVVQSFMRSVLALIPMAAVAYGVWWGLDHLLGRSIWAQIASVVLGYAFGGGAYCVAAWALRMSELSDVMRTLRRRRGVRETEEVIETEREA